MYLNRAKENLKTTHLENGESEYLNWDINSKQTNMLKLQNFKKKIYVIGVYDDPILQMVPLEKDEFDRAKLPLINKDFKEESQEGKVFEQKLIHNIKLIKDVMVDLRPESLVLEMCDDRYDRWLKDVIAHPNYDSTI